MTSAETISTEYTEGSISDTVLIIPSGDIMQILFHILGLGAVLALFFSKPMCPMGICGYSE